MKVLHLVESLEKGAVENWLVRLFRHGNSKGVKLDWTFYCCLGKEGSLAEEVRSLGGRVLSSPVTLDRKREFVRCLRATLKKEAVDVLHAHHDLVSGVYLLASMGLPIRRRLVHVHNADEVVPVANEAKARFLRPILRQACLRLGDGIIGISEHTLDTFLDGTTRRAGRDRVHYYGIDASRFQTVNAKREDFRTAIGLPPDAMILLFAGRIVPEKNPLFVIDVLAELRRRNPQVYGVFVGDGSMMKEVQAHAARLGLEGALRMLGWRDDIPYVMSCSDCFILARPEDPMEGLGIAVVEAQLAGLRLLVSRGIADDPLLSESVYARMGLKEGAVAWAEAAQALLEKRPPTPAMIAESYQESPFEMDFALRDLLALYG